MKRKLAFLGAILLAAFIFTYEGNTYRTHALDEEDQAWIDEAGEALQKIVEEREIMALVYLCDDLTIRAEAAEDSTKVVTVPSGQMVEIWDVTMDEDYQVWEKVSAEVKGKVYEGYIPRDYLACSDERFLEWEELYGMNPGAAVMLAEENATGVYVDIEQFPESYRPALQALKQKHPNWTFVRQNTGLDFQTAVNNELQGGKSLVYKSYGDYCKEGQHSPNWYFASEDVLKLYMDPRNSLQENAIFQFEQLTYNASYHTEEAVKNFLEGTFMNSSQNAPETSMKFYHIFWSIGAEENRQVSPFHLAARVLQEQGAGRTETTRAIFGVDPKDSGEIILEGKTLKITNPNDAIRAGIVLAPEDRKKDGLCTKLSIRHNIALPNLDILCNKLGVVSSKKEDQMCDEAVENLKIKTPNVDINAGNLSGGNQQKVVVGKWLARNSKVVIFDEPTRGIDVAAKVEIYNLMNELKKQGIAVMFVSSEMPEVMGIADRIIVMCDGRITGELDARNTTQNEILTLATQFEKKIAANA